MTGCGKWLLGDGDVVVGREARLGFALEALEFGLLVGGKTRRRGAVLKEGGVSDRRCRCGFGGCVEDRLSGGVVGEEGAKEGGEVARHFGLFLEMGGRLLPGTGEVGSIEERRKKHSTVQMPRPMTTGQNGRARMLR